ncbi:MAG: hypothetical protein ACE5GZ_08260 [Gammaproteobacteria bacterium]
MANVKIQFAFIILLSSIVSGCEQSMALKVESSVPAPLLTKIPLTMGVYYDDQFRHYSYKENSSDRKNWDIESGASQVALFNRILSSMFREVKPVTSLPESGADTGVDAILSPSIEEMQFSLPRETKLKLYEAWIKYKITLYSNDGSVIAEWPLTAYGKTTTEFLKSRDKGLRAAIELALRDAGAKLAIGFPNVGGVKQWLATSLGECHNHSNGVC